MPNLPRSITLIRHGEKPGHDEDTPHGTDAAGRPDERSLTPTGWARAGALCALLGGDPVRTPFVRPTALVASAPEPGESRRNLETLLPLAELLEVPVATPAAKGELGVLVAHVLAQSGRDVLVCWSHEEIPTIAAEVATALGIGVAELPPAARAWPDDDYWTALIFTAGGSGPGWTVSEASESLLAGDPPTTAQ